MVRYPSKVRSASKTSKGKEYFYGGIFIIPIVIGLASYYHDLNWSSSNTTRPYVKTPLGGIKGYYKISSEGRLYEAFEGIPYALPPIGKRRFEPPVPIPAWSNDIEAIAVRCDCAQIYLGIAKEDGQEDCLYLNIYVPAERNISLPILFWIHNGGFMAGSSTDYDEKYLMDKDIIVVTHHYRLGPFGFLSTGDEIVPGNAGLKDQNMALRWISENIRYFGGNPRKLTLGGNSAGASSVHYHYLSPMSAGLFRNGISFSGTALVPWAYAYNSSASTRTLASALGCPVEDSAKMVKCLKKAPVDQVLNETLNMQENLNIRFMYISFQPVSEATKSNYFINNSPRELILKGKVYDAPWITGIVKDEGLPSTLGFTLDEEKIAYVNEHWNDVAPYVLYYKYKLPESKHAELANISKKHYFGELPYSTNRDAVNLLSRLIGDEQYVIDAVKAAKLQASLNKSPVWFFYYTYRAANSNTFEFTNLTENFGVAHGDDVKLVFTESLLDMPKTVEDIAMLKEMLDFWYSVIDKQEPDLGVQWPRLNASKDFNYMHIAGPKKYSMEINDNLGNIKFWTSVGL